MGLGSKAKAGSSSEPASSTSAGARSEAETDPFTVGVSKAQAPSRALEEGRSQEGRSQEGRSQEGRSDPTRAAGPALHRPARSPLHGTRAVRGFMPRTSAPAGKPDPAGAFCGAALRRHLGRLSGRRVEPGDLPDVTLARPQRLRGRLGPS